MAKHPEDGELGNTSVFWKPPPPLCRHQRRAESRQLPPCPRLLSCHELPPNLLSPPGPGRSSPGSSWSCSHTHCAARQCLASQEPHICLNTSPAGRHPVCHTRVPCTRHTAFQLHACTVLYSTLLQTQIHEDVHKKMKQTRAGGANLIPADPFCSASAPGPLHLLPFPALRRSTQTASSVGQAKS